METPTKEWGFYGRKIELDELNRIFARNRWFFVRITGRRRIGKTTLVHRSLKRNTRSFYVQIPDSAPAGVLSAVDDAMDTFQIPATEHKRPSNLREFAQTIEAMVRAGYVVVLDEFQYFNRKQLSEFTSVLQEVVDRLSADAAAVSGGLIVLGSIQTDIDALMRNKGAPLYNRTTDEMDLQHLDVSSVTELISAHATLSPQKLLFLWNLFEGVPKFYRDCYEQDVLNKPRQVLLRRAFFESSSPLRTEADNWFLKELRGRYDVILKYIARNPGSTNADIRAYLNEKGGNTSDQISGHLKILIEKFRMVEKRLPIFSEKKARRGRYYITDNFLRAWLGALKKPVAATHFRSVDQLVADADRYLEVTEGFGFEKLVSQLYNNRSKTGVGFPLTKQIQGYWDAKQTEIDLVAVDDESKTIRFGNCKRDQVKLARSCKTFEGHVTRFVSAFPRYENWRIEKVCLAPEISEPIRNQMESNGYICEDLRDLISDF